ncbi:NHL domain-containing thioredoxin family protein [Actinotalea sp. BY-33]|uniref:NHL domain-containing thioredoxin family protein n=1 Tax=Actinotalea soli TaxID=2819234 RepID=A0A939LTF0_9CELL|nr:NHL domain-containing thioredoxin family protein [Actinotalea soli]MBO1751007.1 NHL domain-containing thioredoxin family protein [Actinotalea soli]
MDRPPVVFTTGVTPHERLPKVRASELVGRGWLNTGGKDVSLADLRGKIVLLDFWTFCCINCLHVLDELREIEAEHRDVLVIVGVHSPKFVHEADPVALAAAVDRYEVHHPVLDDPELTTWSAYSARAWPTLVVVDPEGYIVAHMAGEGHKNNVSVLVRELVAEHEAKGTLHRGDGPYVAPEPTSTTLRFPAKAIRLPEADGHGWVGDGTDPRGGTLLVADAGHHSLVELAADGETLVRRIGSGERGLVDGGPDEARFSEPNGLCLVPEELRAELGFDVLVADTVNHALRGVRLRDGLVTTLAGNGQQFMVGAGDNVLPAGEAPDQARRQKLSSPWDVSWVPALGSFVVAMAGNHTLWSFDGRGTVEHLAGTMNEGLVDGPASEAWFAQTSGLAVGNDGRLWLADSEVSALRWLEATPDGARTGTAVGAGLFDFGHRDGAADQALLQHPLGVAVLPDGSVAIADTYNGAVRRYAPAPDGEGPGEVTTLAQGLAEPSGLLVEVHEDGAVDLLVVESAAHRITRLRLPARLAGELLDAGAHRTARPVSEIGAGEVRLDVVFTPATGQKYDDRYGPSTRLQVSASPPELLLDGAGDDVPLERVLRLNPEVTEGVLHVTAQAASCDADPAIEFPACHLNQQDWGVPVRVVDGGPAELSLPLHG